MPTAPKQRPPVHMLPTAAPATAMAPIGSSSLKAVVSPQGLFPKETAALLAALKRARFNEDGSIKSGEAAVRRAAAAAAQRAGNKYTLTLYIKVPQKLAPDRSVALGKKVDAVNAVLSSPYGRRTDGHAEDLTPSRALSNRPVCRRLLSDRARHRKQSAA